MKSDKLFIFRIKQNKSPKRYTTLPIALAQLKAGNNLENEIKQIVYFSYQSK